MDGQKRFFVADFYNSEHKLVIEIDGEIHERQKDPADSRNRQMIKASRTGRPPCRDVLVVLSRGTRKSLQSLGTTRNQLVSELYPLPRPTGSPPYPVRTAVTSQKYRLPGASSSMGIE